MERYFKDNLAELETELESWLNTPYRHYSGIKGKGVDCIHMVVKVIIKLGANQGRNIVIPHYSKDWHLHRGEKKLINEIERQLFVDLIVHREENKLIFSENVKDGDIILFQYGRQSAHCGIYFNKLVYQTLNPSGVEKIGFNSKNFYNRLTHVYKIYKVLSCQT